VDQKVVVLDLYDAGTDSGMTYSSLDAGNQPREVIRKITGFPALVDGQLVPFGTFTFHSTLIVVRTLAKNRPTQAQRTSG
jgi:hypothetical protein